MATIYKRGKVWWVAYTAPNGKREQRSLHVADRKEAVERKKVLGRRIEVMELNDAIERLLETADYLAQVKAGGALNKEQAARFLGVSVSRLEALCAAGHLHPRKNGTRSLFMAGDLIDFLDALGMWDEQAQRDVAEMLSS